MLCSNLHIEKQHDSTDYSAHLHGKHNVATQQHNALPASSQTLKPRSALAATRRFVWLWQEMTLAEPCNLLR